MKTLSVKQPWSTLICTGIKDVENRTWRTEYRGPLLIHASAQEDRGAELFDLCEVLGDMQLCTRDEENDLPDASDCLYLQNNVMTGRLELRPEFMVARQDLVVQYALLRRLLDEPDRDFFLGGAIIGQVELTDIVMDSPSRWAESQCYHWILAKPVLFDNPVTNVRGRLRLWDFKQPD